MREQTELEMAIEKASICDICDNNKENKTCFYFLLKCHRSHKDRKNKIVPYFRLAERFKEGANDTNE